jgi:hypothetical protein
MDGAVRRAFGTRLRAEQCTAPPPCRKGGGELPDASRAHRPGARLTGEESTHYPTMRCTVLA